MDVKSISEDVARYLKGSDAVASADITDAEEDAATVVVVTQGGVRYLVYVERAVT